MRDCFGSCCTGPGSASLTVGKKVRKLLLVDRHLLREFNISDDELQEAFGLSLASVAEIEEGTIYEHEGVNFDVNAISKGSWFASKETRC